jgi:PBP1b-binding outer membrane lipoprotein LpoB
MSKLKILILILLILSIFILGCIAREKPTTPTPTPTATSELVSDSEINGIDSYNAELNSLINDINELENIDLGLIDETTF